MGQRRRAPLLPPGAFPEGRTWRPEQQQPPRGTFPAGTRGVAFAPTQPDLAEPGPEDFPRLQRLAGADLLRRRAETAGRSESDADGAGLWGDRELQFRWLRWRLHAAAELREQRRPRLLRNRHDAATRRSWRRAARIHRLGRNGGLPVWRAGAGKGRHGRRDGRRRLRTPARREQLLPDEPPRNGAKSARAAKPARLAARGTPGWTELDFFLSPGVPEFAAAITLTGTGASAVLELLAPEPARGGNNADGSEAAVPQQPHEAGTLSNTAIQPEQYPWEGPLEDVSFEFHDNGHFKMGGVSFGKKSASHPAFGFKTAAVTFRSSTQRRRQTDCVGIRERRSSQWRASNIFLTGHLACGKGNNDFLFPSLSSLTCMTS